MAALEHETKLQEVPTSFDEIIKMLRLVQEHNLPFVLQSVLISAKIYSIKQLSCIDVDTFLKDHGNRIPGKHHHQRIKTFISQLKNPSSMTRNKNSRFSKDILFGNDDTDLMIATSILSTCNDYDTYLNKLFDSFKKSCKIYQAQDPSKHTTTLIWLHGRNHSGNAAKKWVEHIENIHKQFKNLKIVMPNAPTRKYSKSGYLKRGWHRIVDIHPKYLNFDKMLSSDGKVCLNYDENGKGYEIADESMYLVHRLMDLELTKNDNDDDGACNDQVNIILGGYSQGGAMSIYAGLQYDGLDKILGIICMSGFVFDETRVENACDNLNVKDGKIMVDIFCGHGRKDKTIPFEWAEKSRDLLEKKKCINLMWKEYDCDHQGVKWIKDPMYDVGHFIGQQLEKSTVQM